jgi:hypothetical protein
MCRNTVPEVLSQKGTRWNGVLKLLFPDIGITDTTPLWLNFGSLFTFQNLFQKKNSSDQDISYVVLMAASRKNFQPNCRL